MGRGSCFPIRWSKKSYYTSAKTQHATWGKPLQIDIMITYSNIQKIPKWWLIGIHKRQQKNISYSNKTLFHELAFLNGIETTSRSTPASYFGSFFSGIFLSCLRIQKNLERFYLGTRNHKSDSTKWISWRKCQIVGGCTRQWWGTSIVFQIWTSQRSTQLLYARRMVRSDPQIQIECFLTLGWRLLPHYMGPAV